MKILIILFCSFSACCQSNWEPFGGYTYSNMLTQYNGLQVVYYPPKNAPNYDSNFHLGINRLIFKKTRISLQIGLGFYVGGSKDFVHVVLPIVIDPPNTVTHLKIPFTLNYKILKNNEFYIVGALLPALLIHRSQIDIGFGLSDNFLPYYPYELDYSIGLRFPLFKRINGTANFTRDLISSNKIEYSDSPLVDLNYHLYSFNFSLIYRL